MIPNLDFNGAGLFDVAYLRNATRWTHRYYKRLIENNVTY